jgi:hypothetical protein
VSPDKDLLRKLPADKLLSKEKSKDPAGENLGDQAVIKSTNLMTNPLAIRPVLFDKQTQMGIRNPLELIKRKLHENSFE